MFEHWKVCPPKNKKKINKIKQDNMENGIHLYVDRYFSMMKYVWSIFFAVGNYTFPEGDGSL